MRDDGTGTLLGCAIVGETNIARLGSQKIDVPVDGGYALGIQLSLARENRLSAGRQQDVVIRHRDKDSPKAV